MFSIIIIDKFPLSLVKSWKKENYKINKQIDHLSSRSQRKKFALHNIKFFSVSKYVQSSVFLLPNFPIAGYSRLHTNTVMRILSAVQVSKGFLHRNRNFLFPLFLNCSVIAHGIDRTYSTLFTKSVVARWWKSSERSDSVLFIGPIHPYSI